VLAAGIDKKWTMFALCMERTIASDADIWKQACNRRNSFFHFCTVVLVMQHLCRCCCVGGCDITVFLPIRVMIFWRVYTNVRDCSLYVTYNIIAGCRSSQHKRNFKRCRSACIRQVIAERMLSTEWCGAISISGLNQLVNSQPLCTHSHAQGTPKR